MGNYHTLSPHTYPNTVVLTSTMLVSVQLLGTCVRPKVGQDERCEMNMSLLGTHSYSEEMFIDIVRQSVSRYSGRSEIRSLMSPRLDDVVGGTSSEN